MSYNGSGTFVINTAGQPVVSGTVISSTAFNALTADLATGLSTAITKDGQTTPTANIPMGNNKITNLAVGTAATDAANLSQVQSTTAKLVNSISGADTITGTMSPNLAAYATGQMFYFIAAGDNTGAVTLNIDSLGAKSVTRDGSVALAAGDIKSGEVVVVVYDGTRFQVVSQINSSGNATFANVSITSALNVGGVATFSAGTAAAPSITTSGDTNNGIFFPATDVTAITTAGSERLRVDSSGNLGLGVTPSAWSGSGYFKAFQIAELGASLSANTATYSGGSNVFLGNNGYHQDSDLTWRYTISQPAAQYRIGATGVHSWYTAPSGTAGGTISFTQAMTLDASGNLGVGTTSPSQKIESYDASAAKISIRVPAGSNASPKTMQLLFTGVDSSGTSPETKAYIYSQDNTSDTQSSFLSFGTRSGATLAERARITSGGDWQVKTGTYAAIIAKGGDTDAEGWNGAQTSLYVGKVNGTGRSINAGGTVNASGADYAEYMEKAGEFVIAKGDVCGIDANGKLTNVYADAVAFVVKSTNPSYVGGDSWGAYLKDDPEGLEAARQKVDRIAFSGQVPVNVLGATPGQYIVPINDSGAIKGTAVSNPSFEQYQAAVGKVIAIEDDGRARIIVKVA